MRITSTIFDSRIKASNVLIELSIPEYVNLVRETLKNNVFQRRRVRSSKTVYALLKDDLLKGCVIPPIVLALTENIDVAEPVDIELFEAALRDNSDHLLILDGLQRTHTVIELYDEVIAAENQENIESIERTKLRVEIYLGLNRLGILYRMLTLNTGQTPMSLRQQVEILYLDYIDREVDGIELVREVDGRIAGRPNQYNFKDVIEGFNSYLHQDELPLDKSDVLENIRGLEKLSKENQDQELFDIYLHTFHNFLGKVMEVCDGAELGEAYLEDNSSPFGKTINQVFKKPQAMSGFGAAAARLIEVEAINDLSSIDALTQTLTLDNGSEYLEEINDTLEWLKSNTKKIGNAQRTFFSFYFRDLFNSDSDSYLDLSGSIKSGLRKYQSLNM